MSEAYPAELEQKARDFIGSLKASLKVRRFAEAYLEHLTVGGGLPDMPLFLDPDYYVNVPLEATYQGAWRGTPERWRRVLEAGA